ncbi:hypothetical protein [Leifsonia naganoensis]|uniref:Uncharacterized protein n=1 Tax=Leifsonia naganoensis TaxID=150025 RepID=A0A853DLV9_9MICO|nr:hypothetical protein [Leifsonia naganoensis]NYK08573.1 hypothetical protein [Leifsonia naganoensis]
MATATPDQISEALARGELVTYMGGKTDAETAQESRVKDTPDRLYAEAYGFSSYTQMENAGNAYGSTVFEKIRRQMSPEQLTKLDWLDTATPQEAYAAEQAGELDQLLGRGRHQGANRADGINRDVRGPSLSDGPDSHVVIADSARNRMGADV